MIDATETRTATATWTKVAAGHYQREDGVSIRKVDGRKFRGGGAYIPRVWWFAYDADGRTISSIYPCRVGGGTFAEAVADLARHEATNATR